MTSSPNPPPQSRSVLIGIVTKNRADILPRSINSALSQKGATITVSVIDDGSSDSTAKMAPWFPSVEWVTWPESHGHMAARNHWMSQAPADYFVSLDDDAWFIQGDEIEKALISMETNPRIGAIGFDILSPDRPQPQTCSGIERVSCFIGCGHMLRLSVVKQTGGYEEFPGSYGSEEKDFCLRLMDAGYEIVRLKGVHVWHDKTPLARDIAAQHRSGVCNDLVMTVRRTPIYLLPFALLTKFYRHSVFSVRNGLFLPAIAGFALFLRSLPKVWQSRHPVKASTLRTFMQLRAR